MLLPVSGGLLCALSAHDGAHPQRAQPLRVHRGPALPAAGELHVGDADDAHLAGTDDRGGHRADARLQAMRVDVEGQFGPTIVVGIAVRSPDKERPGIDPKLLTADAAALVARIADLYLAQHVGPLFRQMNPEKRDQAAVGRILPRWTAPRLAEVFQRVQELEQQLLLSPVGGHAALGEARRAIEYYEQALAIRREIGDRRGEGREHADGDQGHRRQRQRHCHRRCADAIESSHFRASGETRENSPHC